MIENVGQMEWKHQKKFKTILRMAERTRENVSKSPTISGLSIDINYTTLTCAIVCVLK